LIDAQIQLWCQGQLVDEVKSYTAMQTVNIQRDRFMLNGQPYYLRLVLDQGYWEDTLMTAPSDDALRRDVELVKQIVSEFQLQYTALLQTVNKVEMFSGFLLCPVDRHISGSKRAVVYRSHAQGSAGGDRICHFGQGQR
jgi:hypothetical protein